MYKLNSGFRWTVSKYSEIESVTLPWTQQNTDCVEKKEYQTDRIIDTDTGKCEKEQQLETLISNLLKYGVLLASAVVLFGGIIYLVHHGSELPEYDYFHGEPSQLRSPSGIINTVVSANNTQFETLRECAIMQLGLLLLIATPILRVIVSLLFFLRMRDLVYVVITSLVLSALTYSLVGAYY